MNYTPPPQADIDKWHRWFAVECNNRAWELADQPERTEEQIKTMLCCAFASSWHWDQVGSEINTARAEALLAWVHAVAGQGAAALQHASRARTLIDRPVDNVGTWDRAFMPVAEAMAAQAAGKRDLHRTAYARLNPVRGTLDDPVDLEVFDRFVKQISEPD